MTLEECQKRVGLPVVFQKDDVREVVLLHQTSVYGAFWILSFKVVMRFIDEPIGGTKRERKAIGYMTRGGMLGEPFIRAMPYELSMPTELDLIEYKLLGGQL